MFYVDSYGKELALHIKMKKYLIILLILTTYCSPVRNRGYDYDVDPRGESEGEQFEYQYAQGDSLSDEDFFGEDDKSGKDMSNYVNGMDERLRDRLAARGELGDDFDDFYENEEKSSNEDMELEQFYMVKGFTDTTRLVLNNDASVMMSGYDALNIKDVFINGKAFFENEYYDKASKRFRYIKETALPEDTLYYTSIYYLAETHIAKNRFSDALSNLELIINSNIINENREKSLVRVGQIYCVLNMKDKASKYFDMLEKEFPQSLYISVANCNSIGN